MKVLFIILVASVFGVILMIPFIARERQAIKIEEIREIPLLEANCEEPQMKYVASNGTMRLVFNGERWVQQ